MLQANAIASKLFSVLQLDKGQSSLAKAASNALLPVLATGDWNACLLSFCMELKLEIWPNLRCTSWNCSKI